MPTGSALPEATSLQAAPSDQTSTVRRLLPQPGGKEALVGFLLAMALIAAACAAPPTGPTFALATHPPEHRARIYLFRSDDRPSLSKVRVTMDGRDLGTFRNDEYEMLEVAAGSHHLRAGLRSFALVAWGWNDQRIRIEPGGTSYVRLSVRLTERAQPGGRNLEIAGRTSGAASENVYLQILPEDEALPRLRVATRLVP
ncbi:MAG: hypothetical protein GY910_08445 [bacterium]|nr:hypothetical protein [bacterium]